MTQVLDMSPPPPISNVGSELGRHLVVAKKTTVLVHTRRHPSAPTLYTGARGVEQCGATVYQTVVFFARDGLSKTLRPSRHTIKMLANGKQPGIAQEPDRPTESQTKR